MDRYRTRQGQHDYRDRYSRDRQAEQYSSGDEWQQGDDRWRSQERRRNWSDDYDRGYDRDENRQRDDFARSGGGYRGDTSSLDDYDRLGTTRYGRDETTHSYFRGDDFGGQDYTRGSAGSRNYGSRNYGANSHPSVMYGSSGSSRIPPRQYDSDDRGFFDRASDEVMSWFGDDDAARRREMDHREDHRGKGPSGYTRSKERILEDANERLMRDPRVDASNITVTSSDDEITLDGTVDSRSAKRRAEDIVDDISGVKHVQNNLRVESRESYYSQSGTSSHTEA